MNKLPNIIAFILLMLMLIGCTTVKYVPVTSVQRDSVYISQVQRDSVMMWTDTSTKQYGDTIIIERTKIVTQTQYRTDSLFKQSVDTITQIVEIEKPLTKWEQTKMELGGVAMGGLVFAIIASVIFIIIKLRR